MQDQECRTVKGTGMNNCLTTQDSLEKGDRCLKKRGSLAEGGGQGLLIIFPKGRDLLKRGKKGFVRVLAVGCFQPCGEGQKKEKKEGATSKKKTPHNRDQKEKGKYLGGREIPSLSEKEKLPSLGGVRREIPLQEKKGKGHN